MKKTKLLRDNRGDHQPEHLEYLRQGGEPYNTVVIPDSVVNLVLVGKLHEEAEEIRENLQDKSEYADALQILMDLAARNGVNWQDVTVERVRKEGSAGGFGRTGTTRVLIRYDNCGTCRGSGKCGEGYNCSTCGGTGKAKR